MKKERQNPPSCNSIASLFSPSLFCDISDKITLEDKAWLTFSEEKIFIFHFTIQPICAKPRWAKTKDKIDLKNTVILLK